MAGRQQIAGAGVQGAVDLDRLVGVGFGLFLVLAANGDDGFYLPELRRRAPNARILLRFYDTNLIQQDPRQWARRCRDIFRPYASLGNIEVIPSNEMNIPDEGGGDTEAWYDRIDSWLLEWIDEWRKEFRTVRAHWPALAPLHGEDYKGYPRCLKSLAAYDAVDVHGYWGSGGLDDPEGPNTAFLDVDLIKRFAPGKPIFVTEYNRAWNHSDVGDGDRYAGDVIDYLTRLQAKGVAGTATFLYVTTDPRFKAFEWIGQPVEARVQQWIGANPGPAPGPGPTPGPSGKQQAALAAAIGGLLTWLLTRS